MKLTGQQKIGVAVLSVFSMLIFVFWFIELKTSLYTVQYGDGGKPTAIGESPLVTGDRSTDTDTDGLSDYDELNVYKTSPYLADTDGDNLNDGDETKNGTDPNCPLGKDCVGQTVFIPGQNPESNVSITAPDLSLSSDQAEILKNAFGDKPDPQTIRAALTQTATKDEDKAMIDKLTDQQLLDLFNQMTAESAQTN